MRLRHPCQIIERVFADAEGGQWVADEVPVCPPSLREGLRSQPQAHVEIFVFLHHAELLEIECISSVYMKQSAVGCS